MTPPHTVWQTQFYDPDSRRKYYEALFDSVHHLVYAALIDGICTVTGLCEIIPRTRLTIQWVLQDLEAAGYVERERASAIGNKVIFLPKEVKHEQECQVEG